MFHDPGALAKDLHRSRQRLKWHLWRIYRARNLLVHVGMESPMLLHLLSHLQFYLSTAISRLLHRVTHDAELDAAKAASYWCELGNRVLDEMSANPAQLKVSELMTNPQIRTEECPWLPTR
jgi:hypothetical protein